MSMRNQVVPVKVAKNDLHALVALPIANPAMETLLGFIRSFLLFVVSFGGQYLFTHQSSLTSLSTYTALLPMLIYWVLSAVTRYLRYANSPLAPVSQSAMDADRKYVADHGGVVSDLPDNIQPGPFSPDVPPR